MKTMEGNEKIVEFVTKPFREILNISDTALQRYMVETFSPPS